MKASLGKSIAVKDIVGRVGLKKFMNLAARYEEKKDGDVNADLYITNHTKRRFKNRRRRKTSRGNNPSRCTSRIGRGFLYDDHLSIELYLLSREYVICIHLTNNACIVELEAYQEKHGSQPKFVHATEWNRTRRLSVLHVLPSHASRKTRPITLKHSIMT